MIGIIELLFGYCQISLNFAQCAQMVTFVTFHIDLPSTDSSGLIPIETYVPDPLRYIEAMFLSAELFHPGCEKVLLTDTTTRLEALAPDIQVIRFPDLNAATPAFSRLQAQIAYLEQLDSPKNLLFLDSDILINANLDALFERPFDVALTYRLHMKMLFNGGVIFIKEREHAGSRFLMKIREHFLQHHSRYLTWYGFQLSLLTYVHPDRFLGRPTDTLTIDGLRILFLDCATYNFTPSRKTNAITVEYSDKKILHFIGKRKFLFWQYWEKFFLPKLRKREEKN